MRRPEPIEKEKFLGDDEILVSKTDRRGKITYGNERFIEISGYSEEELLGAPHSIIRHPDMPKAVFKILWDGIEAGEEVAAYVKNLAKDGSYYWVFATVTPSFDPATDSIVGYFSVRRAPESSKLRKVIPLYKELLRVEKSGGMEASKAMMDDILKKEGKRYDEFIHSL
ncbi:putative signal-transduction sensor protein [Hydrogenimonas sp.]|nr:putative signal-transduction sensor protein [Hydrogenimonas sp.]